MLDKAPLVWALCTGASIESVLVLVACHSDSAERRFELVYHCMHGFEKLLETCQCMRLAETRSVEGPRIGAAGTARVSTVLSSERFLDGPDTTLAQVC